MKKNEPTMPEIRRHAIGRQRGPRGLTMLELLIALFVFMVGIMGVMMALPTGTASASWVIFQDAAIHLSQSKFSEFRRDRVDPGVDLKDGSGYMGGGGVLSTGRAAGKQEPLNSSPGGWRDFAHASSDDTYYYFDDINRYEWRIDNNALKAVGSGTGGAPAGFMVPQNSGGTAINLYNVTVVVHMKGTSRELRFTQYMMQYDQP